MDTHNTHETGSTSASPATRTLGMTLAAVALVLVLTWAVSVFFEIALLKALAAVVLILFFVVVALFMFGIT